MSMRSTIIVAGLLLVLAGQSTAQITIVQAAGGNLVPQAPVAGLAAGQSGTVKLDPAAPVARLAPPAAGSTFLNTFAADVAEYPGWTAVTGAALKGTLTIDRYQALSPTGSATLGTPNAGARMWATYAVAAGDGFALADLKWIQMFTDNTGPNGGLVRHIDPFPNDDTLPWYYTAAEDGGTLSQFRDTPGDKITSVPFHRFVKFETYLASFNATTKVATIHDGFAWGYDIRVVPTPGSAGMLALAGICALRRRRG